MKSRISLVVATGLVIALLAGCGIGGPFAPGPSATVEQFAKATSNKDIRGMLDCCSQATNDCIDSLSQISGGLLDLAGAGSVDLKELVITMIPALYNYAQISGQDFDFKVEAKDLTETMTGEDTAIVTGTWVFTSYSGSYSETEEEPLELNLVREDGRWKIDFTEEVYAGIGSLLGI